MKTDLEQCTVLNNNIYINRLTKKQKKKLNEMAASDPLRYIELYHSDSQLNRDMKRLEEYRFALIQRNYSPQQLKDILNHYECELEKLDAVIENNSIHASLGIAFSAIGIATYGILVNLNNSDYDILLILFSVLITVALSACMYYSFAAINKKNINRKREASLFCKILKENYELKVKGKLRPDENDSDYF